MIGLTNAIRLAVQAHDGQLDKAGQPYILHALRIGAAGQNLEEQIVGFLHDVLEDTELSPSILQRAFTPEINIALAAITREPGESYKAYINRVSCNPIACAVKVRDLKDNLGRLGQLHTTEAESLRRRYRAALAQLGIENF